MNEIHLMFKLYRFYSCLDFGMIHLIQRFGFISDK